jgi:hypothetical protein
MRRRILFTLLSFLSLLVCSGGMAMWVRSYWREDRAGAQSQMTAEGDQRGGRLSSASGRIELVLWARRYQGEPLPASIRSAMAYHRSLTIVDPTMSSAPERIRWQGGFHFLGFICCKDKTPVVFGASSSNSPTPLTLQTFWVIVIPHGALAALMAVMPAVWFLRWRRRKPGHCRCGYSLTGNTSGVCPECGTKVSEHAQPANGVNSSEV